MNIQGAVALVTGGNRGLGKAFVQALLDAGAKKVYLGTRHSIEVSDPRLQSLQLDITNASDIDAAAAACQDVTILVNNAGTTGGGPLLGASSMESARQSMETNYLGTLAMCRAFAPVLAKNGGGAIVNMLSVLSWFTQPFAGSYSASKAAEFSLTNGIRIELRQQGTLVLAVHAGYIDTESTANLKNVEKMRPEEVATLTIEALQAGQEEVLVDRLSHQTRAALAADPHALNRQMQELWNAGRR